MFHPQPNFFITAWALSIHKAQGKLGERGSKKKLILGTKNKV